LQTRPTYAVFQYQDVMNVLKDANTFTSGFILEGMGKVWDGLMILGMDGEAHRKRPHHGRQTGRDHGESDGGDAEERTAGDGELGQCERP